MISSADSCNLHVGILEPSGKDAILTANILSEAFITSSVCPDVPALEKVIAEGAGVLLIAEEAVTSGGKQVLADALSRQEPWSDLPVLLLTQYRADSATVARALQTLGNVTLLERPVRPATLISALRAALKARERQYQVRPHLLERERTPPWKQAQVDRSSRRAQGGLGIGLTLVRTLVEMHGGRVEARSPGKNQGSEFVVTLPLSESAGVSPVHPPKTLMALPSHHRVLIVDDNRDAADSLGLLLRVLGGENRVVNDGPSALQAMQS